MSELAPEWLKSAVEFLPENEVLAGAVSYTLLLTVALTVYYALRRGLPLIQSLIMRRTSPAWVQELDRHDVLITALPIVPLAIFNFGILVVPIFSGPFAVFLQRLLLASMALVAARGLSSFLDAINSIYCRYPVSRGRPIKGYLQAIAILGYGAALILGIAFLIGQSPLYLLSGLGAMTAVIMLIFRDSLLSLVAGIQLTGNDLLRVGDWIEMPQFNADGFVIDISLNVVKVQNWDKTITVIPAHKFLENSFRNWRTMFESGGRRIKRSIFLDMSSIRFLTPEEIERFKRFTALRGYLEEKLKEIEEYNATEADKDSSDILANTRHLTNIGTFRAYVTGYLKRSKHINHDLTFLIRQLQPTSQGLPLEIYVFTNDTRWAYYEGIQADIFDHLFAIIPDFGLRVFQEPTGGDFARLAKQGASGGF